MAHDLYQCIVKEIQEYLFPLFCVGCNAEGVIVCVSCIEKIPRAGVFFCPVCHKESRNGACCPSCAHHSFVDAHIAISPYREGDILGRLIQQLKYHYIENALYMCEKVINSFLDTHRFLLSGIESIVPVPLHPRRYAERGFNQAACVATIVGRHMNIPIEHILVRSRYTKQQAKLDRDERFKNTRDAFCIQQKTIASRTSVLLVDDVFTTGATMQACARALKEEGIKTVTGFSIARG